MGVESNLTRLIPELQAYAMSIAANKTAAEDLVQDALERALKSPNSPERIRDLRPWMFKTIRNLHFDELRKYRVRREYAKREKRFSHGSVVTKDHARDVLVRMAFERLPAEKKEVLFLVDIVGLKYAEAADVMEVAIGTVMSRLSRARRAMIAVVEEEGDRPNKRSGSDN